tara:strand:- start:298 stop:474 length:177 start_codon:yes stop_codon:yes gene_type:complete
MENYFKRNPISYALALEGNNFSDEQIKNALENSKWYSEEVIELTIKQLIDGRKEKASE